MPAVAGYDPNPSDNVRVEVAFTTQPDDASPAWVDLTSRLDLAAGININRGRADEFSVIQPSTCSLTLDNNDGALTAGNAGSTFYPYVKPHRRIRVTYRNPDVAGNLLTVNQASMETSISDWSANGSVPPTLSQSSTRAWDGTKSLLITWGTGGSFPFAGTNVAGLAAGRTYTATAYVYVPAGSPAVKLAVGGVGVSLTPSSTTNAWQRISYTFTAAASTISLQVWPDTATTAGQQAWVDAVMLDEGSAAATFTLTAPSIQYRFDGHVEEWPVEWPNGGKYAQAQISAIDRLARIGAKRPMRSVIEEAILAANPFCYWPLGEPEGASLAGDISGTPGVSTLSIQQVGVGGTLDFGTATGPPTDALPAPTFTPVSVTNGKHLLGTVPNLGLSGSLGFFPVTTFGTFLTSAAVAQTVMRRADEYGSYVDVGLNASGNVVVTQRSQWASAADVTVTSPLTYKDGATHSFAVTQSVSGSTLTTTLYIDGASVASGTHTATFTQLSTRVRIGGGPSGAQFNGVITHVAGFSGALTAAQILEIHTATTTGYVGDSSDERIARYANWAGIPTADRALDAGSSTSIAFTDTTGQSVLQAMQDVASTEGGRLFIDGRGRLVFHARSRSYDNAAAVASIDANLLGQSARFSISTQGLVNDATGQRPDGPTIRAFDQDSIDEYGVLDPGALTLLVTSDTEVADAVNWRVHTNSTPRVRIPQTELDAYTDSTGYQAQIRALELGDRLTITGLPSTAPASTVDLIVEGYSETIGLTGWTVSANTSNYSETQGWVWDSSHWDDGSVWIY